LALASPRGLYLLELLEIDPAYEEQFASFLTCIEACLGKGFVVEQMDSDDSDTDIDEKEDDAFADHMDNVHTKLVETCATLETMMPVQWSTITRNLLLEKPGNIKEWGENWVTGLLHVERLHTLIRSMCVSKKSHMVGFMNQYRLWTHNQLDWRFATEYANNPRPSAVCVKEPFEKKPKLSVPGSLVLCLFYVCFMSVLCLFYVFFMSFLCLFYVFFMSFLCLFYVFFMSFLCLL
jgi:hypothetical protein